MQKIANGFNRLRDSLTLGYVHSLFLLIFLVGCASSESSRHRGIYIVRDEAIQIGQGMCVEGGEESSWAVVIGVNKYRDTGIPTLSGAAQDAWNIYHYLTHKDGGGIHPKRTRLLINEEATKAAVEKSLGEFLANACPQDRLIIYFAGHGAPDPSRPSDAYLLVHDTQLDELLTTGISMTLLPTFLRWRNQDKGKLLLIVDACHSGALQFPGQRGFTISTESLHQLELTRAKSVTRSLSSGVKGMNGWGVIAAAAPDQQASEGEEGCEIGGVNYPGGVFTCALFKALGDRPPSTGRQGISYDQLFADLSQTMLGLRGSLQLPQRSGSLSGSSVVFKLPDRPIPIPPFPERYLSTSERPLQPWIWGGLASSLGATSLALYFQREANLKTREINTFLDSSVGDKSIDAYQLQTEERSTRVQRTKGAYLTAGILGGVALALGIIELSTLPPPPSASYDLPPSLFVGTPSQVSSPGAQP